MTCLHSQQHPTAGRLSPSRRLDRVRKEQDVQRNSTAADAPAQQRWGEPDKVSLAVKVQCKGVLEVLLLPGDCAILRCGSGAAPALAVLCWLPAASRLAQVPVVQQSRLMLLWQGAGLNAGPILKAASAVLWAKHVGCQMQNLHEGSICSRSELPADA